MTKRVQAPPERRCKARNKRGEPCAATVVGASGYCVAHDPERPIDMRELGHRGGKSRRKGVAEKLPAGERESLRQYLRDGLDHETIKAAIERSLAGNNESARVSAVKLLSDFDLYGGRDGVCSQCGMTEEEREAEVVGSRQKLLELLVGRAERREAQGFDPVEAEVERRTASSASRVSG